MPHTVINYEQLVQRCMGNLELAERVLGRFNDRLATDLDELHNSLLAEAHEDTRRIAHRVKGSCANVGADSLCVLVTDLEQLAASREIFKPSDWMERISRERDRLEKAVSVGPDNPLPKQPVTSPPAPGSRLV